MKKFFILIATIVTSNNLFSSFEKAVELFYKGDYKEAKRIVEGLNPKNEIEY